MLPSLLSLFQAAAPRPLPAPAAELLGALTDPARARHRGEGARRRTRDTLRAASQRFDGGDIEAICEADLIVACEVYDRTAFDGALSRLLAPDATRPRLRLSRRLRTSAGVTKRITRRLPSGAHTRHEIALSLPILFGAFADGVRPAVVSGLPCHDRVDVLLAVLEHELVHLFENLALGNSSCRRPPFRALAATLFGHTESSHRVEPPSERAARLSGIRPGDTVRFVHRGRERRGIVNRITRRATVLVPHPDGVPYTDGGRYRKYYVPLARLEPASL